MRAARLLHCLLLLQNRGRMTSVALAHALEVSPRTILRDVDAMTEAGLPIIVHQGNQGGIELGFDYRTKLTGLSHAEADALGVILSMPLTELDAIGMGAAGRMALSKLRESLPDVIRARAAQTSAMFRIGHSISQSGKARAPDPRLAAMAQAVRGRNFVTLQATTAGARRICPVHLAIEPEGARVTDQAAPDQPIPLEHWGNINISAKTFE